MDEQRLERALRQGPGFATRYVARPPVLDDSLVPQGSAGGGRVALMIAVTALLVGLVVGAIAVGSGLVKLPVIVPVPSPAPLVHASPTPDATDAVRPSGVVAYAACTPDPEDPSSCTGDSRIWVVNDDGTGAHELRPDEPGSQDPIAWSPDGSELLYSSDAWGVDLAITDAAGSAPEVLPNESLCPVDARDCLASLHDAVFSPDGERLAYAIFSGADGSANPCTGGCGGGTIAVLEIATGQVTRLDASRIPGATLCCDGYYAPSWSADGTRLAFAMPPLTSFTINVDGSDLRQLVPVGEGEFGTAPRWSPDGSTIASSVCGTRPTIYLVQPDGGDLRTVGRDACDPRWTRDGRIVFSRYYDGPASDWIMDADGGNVRRLDNTIPALTAAGCIVCTFRDGDGVNRRGLWQPVATDQP